MNANTLPNDATPALAGSLTPALRVRGALATEIRLALQGAIERGELPPGAPLDEKALCQQFNVSRTPVREALQQLASQELVQTVPRQGMIVSRFSVTQLRAMLEGIAELEGTCAKLAARRFTAKDGAALEQALQQCHEAAVNGTTADYGRANEAFHEVIYTGCCNPYLAELIRKARRQIQRYRINDFQAKAHISQSLQGHVRIARAIRAADEAAALTAMLEHVPSGNSGFSEFLARMPASLFQQDH